MPDLSFSDPESIDSINWLQLTVDRSTFSAEAGVAKLAAYASTTAMVVKKRCILVPQKSFGHGGATRAGACVADGPNAERFSQPDQCACF